MSFFNWEDFMRAAAGVAQGELLGKQQAQQEAMQRQQQETQNALQLGQLGQQQDEANFGAQDRLDQQYLQSVFPKLDTAGQKLFLDAWSGNQARRNEDRTRAMAARSGLVAPHLRPYFTMPRSQAMGMTPAAAPPAEATPQAAPAAGSAAPNRQVHLPGYPPLTLRGLTPEQSKAYIRDLDEADKAIREFDGDPAVLTKLNDYRHQIADQPADETEFQQGYTGINNIRQLTAGNAANVLDRAEKDFTARQTRISRLMEQLRKPGTSAEDGARIVRQVRGLEKDLAARHKGKFDPATEGSLLGYENQFATIEKETDAGKQGKAFQDIARELRDNVPAGAVAREAIGMQQVLSHMSLRDQKDKVKVEKALRLRGYARAADDVKANGVPPPDPYHADKALQDWYGKAPQWADKDTATQNAFLAEGRALAEAAGLSETEIQTRIPAALGKKPAELTPYQQQTLSIKREQMERSWAGLDETKRKNDLMEAKTRTAQGSTHITALLRNKQYEINDVIKRLTAIRTQYALTDAAVAAGHSTAARQAQGMEKELHEKRHEWQSIYRNLTGVNPRTGARFAPPPALQNVPALRSPASRPERARQQRGLAPAPALPFTPAQIDAELRRRKVQMR